VFESGQTTKNVETLLRCGPLPHLGGSNPGVGTCLWVVPWLGGRWHFNLETEACLRGRFSVGWKRLIDPEENSQMWQFPQLKIEWVDFPANEGLKCMSAPTNGASLGLSLCGPISQNSKCCRQSVLFATFQKFHTRAGTVSACELFAMTGCSELDNSSCFQRF